MGYNPNLDKTLGHREIQGDSGTGGYEVKLVQYDKGDIKIQINPYFIDREGEKRYKKLSRIKLSEWEGIDIAVREMQSNLKL